MDGDRFDEFTRAITRDTSRRGFLKKLGAGIAGVLGASAAVEETQAGPKKCKFQGSSCKGNVECCSLNCCNRVCCGDGQICCNGQCVRACPAGKALDEACACQATPPACTSAAQCPQSADPCRPAVCVSGQCGFADLNGFACDDGNACTTGTTCQNGSCGGGTALSCDDDNPCTADICNPASGCVYTPLSDVLCGSGGSCQNGTCVTADPCAGVNCDDGNPCTTDACSVGPVPTPPSRPGPPARSEMWRGRAKAAARASPLSASRGAAGPATPARPAPPASGSAEQEPRPAAPTEAGTAPAPAR